MQKIYEDMRKVQVQQTPQFLKHKAVTKGIAGNFRVYTRQTNEQKYNR